MRLCFCLLFPVFFARAASLDLLQATLMQMRSVEDLTAAQHAKVRDAALQWLDEQIRAGKSIQAMNRDLTAAGLIAPHRDDIVEVQNARNAGYLMELSEERKGPVRVVTLPIGTSSNCGVDDTVVIYGDSSTTRIAVLNANDELDSGRYLVDSAVQQNPTTKEWTFASAWFLSSCTSTFTEVVLRVDRADSKGKRNLYRGEGAAKGVGSEDMKIAISAAGDRILFQYFEPIADSWVSVSPVRKKISITPSSVEIFEYAQNLAGFLWQNIRSDASWRNLEWDGVAVCDNAWEITVHSESRRGIFRVSGTKAESLRFEGERTRLTAGCVSVPDGPGLAKTLFQMLP